MENTNQWERTELLFGEKAMRRLANSRVAVFGIGGVGGHAVEALIRSGIGAIDLIDSDQVSPSNLNRQIIATRESIGRYKTEVMRERILSIHPECNVTTHRCFYLPETKDQFDFSSYDYVVDAIDTVTGKIQLVMQAQESGTPIISSMGTGNKLDPTQFEVADIYQTSVCPLARVMRRELKKRNVEHLKVVYSREKPCKVQRESPVCEEPEICPAKERNAGQRGIPGSVAFVPSVAGLIIAGEVIRDLTTEGE